MKQEVPESVSVFFQSVCLWLVRGLFFPRGVQYCFGMRCFSCQLGVVGSFWLACLLCNIKGAWSFARVAAWIFCWKGFRIRYGVFVQRLSVWESLGGGGWRGGPGGATFSCSSWIDVWAYVLLGLCWNLVQVFFHLVLFLFMFTIINMKLQLLLIWFIFPAHVPRGFFSDFRLTFNELLNLN